MQCQETLVRKAIFVSVGNKLHLYLFISEGKDGCYYQFFFFVEKWAGSKILSVIKILMLLFITQKDATFSFKGTAA